MTERVARYLAALLVATPGIAAWGAEGGSTEYIGGFSAFAAGYLPADAGTYFSNDLYFYDGSTSKLTARGRIAFNISTDMYIDTVQLTHMTSYTFLGANYGFGVALPVGHVSVDANISPSSFERSASTSGLGDLNLIPLLLGWHSQDLYANLAFTVFAPTGQYNQAQPVNLSLHYWALDATYSVSLLTEKGFDLSASLGYTVNFENPTTHYKSGDVAHLDLAVGQNLTQEFKVGIAGYAVVQVSGDSGAGAILGPFKSDIYAAGPALEYDTKLRARDLSVGLRWYREFDAKNHLAGNAVYLTSDLAL
jgi:hypothetical protein